MGLTLLFILSHQTFHFQIMSNIVAVGAWVERFFRNIIQSKYSYHYLFWTIRNIITFSYYKTMNKEDIIIQIFQFVLVLIMAYTNILFLIPKFYKQKKFLHYTFYSVSLILFITLIARLYLAFFTRWGWQSLNWFEYFDMCLRHSSVYLLSLFLGLTDDWKQQEKRLSAMQTEKIKAELNFLRSQVNPHFLFNTLNNLYSLALEKSDKTPEYILKLSNIMDYMLYESNEMEVPLEKDLDNLKNYIEIERIRHLDGSKIQFDIEGNTKSQMIAPLILLPLVENAFKHGLNARFEDNFVKALVQVEGQKLSFFIENNKNTEGVAFEEKGHGIGLQNLYKRLELFYPKRHYIEITENAKTYAVLLKLDL
jgi:two-component system, LytTR family, sensor kinase